MFTALLILGIVAVIVLLSSSVLVTVLVCQALQKQADVLDRSHDRWTRSLDPLLDRLMAHNWEEYTTLRTVSDEGQGGFFAPDEQQDEYDQDEGQYIPSWGSLMAPIMPDADNENEERLLVEDFDDDNEPVRRVSS